MLKTLVCPHCGKSGKITTIDNQPLANYHDEELARQEDYFLENQVYAMAKCWDCKHEFDIESGVSWRPSKNSPTEEIKDEVIHIVKKDFFVNYSLNGISPNETFATAISVEYPIDKSASDKFTIILNKISTLHKANYASGNFIRNCYNSCDIVIKVLTEI